jgi:hypothetical protein
MGINGIGISMTVSGLPSQLIGINGIAMSPRISGTLKLLPSAVTVSLKALLYVVEQHNLVHLKAPLK